ncbi:MAG: AAA family ATPase [Solirubrobacteraceae bacterium]
MGGIEGGTGRSTGLLEREAEMSRICSALDDVSRGEGALLVIEGPAGIGKSRLLAEACGHAEPAGLQVLRARGGVLERDLAYGAVRLLLERPLAALSERERDDVLGGAAGLVAPALAAAGGEQQAPGDRGFAVIHGLFWCISNLADRRPLLLALDDAHWFDAPSLRFLLYLARRVAELPVAMIVATRPDERGPEPLLVEQLGVEPDAEVLRPAAFTPDGVSAVLSERMGGVVAPEFGAACHAAVGGNPFLLSELAGALVADGVRPAASAAAHLRDVRPPTLSRAILLRLGRMPAGAAELATAVAILGEGVSLEQARRLAGQDEPAAADALDRLAAPRSSRPRRRWTSCTRSSARRSTGSSGRPSVRTGTPERPSSLSRRAAPSSGWRRIYCPRRPPAGRRTCRRCAARRAGRRRAIPPARAGRAPAGCAARGHAGRARWGRLSVRRTRRGGQGAAARGDRPDRRPGHAGGGVAAAGAGDGHGSRRVRLRCGARGGAGGRR